MRSVRDLLDRRVPGVAELDAMCASACQVSGACALIGRGCDGEPAKATAGKVNGRGCVAREPLTFPPFTLELTAAELATFIEDPDGRPYIWEM